MAKETPWDLRWLRQIARDPDARVGLAVAAVMSDRMDGRTHETFVSQTTIAADLQLSVESVRKAQKRLVEGGHLRLVTAGRGGRNASGQTTTQPNTYRAVLSEAPQQSLGGKAGELPNETLGVGRGNSPRILDETPQGFEENSPPNLGTIPRLIPLGDPEERGASRRKPEKPLPEGFPGPAEIASGVEYFVSRGIVADATVQAERFRNWHLAHDTRARCWSATWRTWLSKTRPDAPQTTAQRSGPHDFFAQAQAGVRR